MDYKLEDTFVRLSCYKHVAPTGARPSGSRALQDPCKEQSLATALHNNNWSNSEIFQQAPELKDIPAVGADDGADDLAAPFQCHGTTALVQLASRHRINAIAFAEGGPVQAITAWLL